MNIIKKILRRPSILAVTIYARVIYNQGVTAAEERHRKEGNQIYLASKTFRPDRLVTYDKAQFKAEKRLYGASAILTTMNTLRRGCYYYTADRFGRDGMEAKERERRRKAFIKERLQKAGLI